MLFCLTCVFVGVVTSVCGVLASNGGIDVPATRVQRVTGGVIVIVGAAIVGAGSYRAWRRLRERAWLQLTWIALVAGTVLGIWCAVAPL